MIKNTTNYKKQNKYLGLLLKADPNKDMIIQYIQSGDMYVYLKTMK
jgi:hypothetical protein